MKKKSSENKVKKHLKIKKITSNHVFSTYSRIET